MGDDWAFAFLRLIWFRFHVFCIVGCFGAFVILYIAKIGKICSHACMLSASTRPSPSALHDGTIELPL